MRMLALMALLCVMVGCGETTLPTRPFTDEEKAKIKAEDQAVADEEGGKPVKKKK